MSSVQDCPLYKKKKKLTRLWEEQFIQSDLQAETIMETQGPMNDLKDHFTADEWKANHL